MRISLPIYATINGILMLLLLGVYIGILRQAKLEERASDFGDGLSFMTFAVPVLALGFFLNLYWLIKSVYDIRRRHNYHSVMALTFVILAWVALYFMSYYIS